MKPLQTETSSWRKVLALLVGLICTLNVAAQKLNVKGSVTDQNGEPVIGATIMEEGTKNGVVTVLMVTSLYLLQVLNLDSV